MDEDEEKRRAAGELAAKNRRLAIILGLIAAGFYLVFVLYYWK